MTARWRIEGRHDGDRYTTTRYEFEARKPQPQPGWSWWRLSRRTTDGWTIVEAHGE